MDPNQIPQSPQPPQPPAPAPTPQPPVMPPESPLPLQAPIPPQAPLPSQPQPLYPGNPAPMSAYPTPPAGNNKKKLVIIGVAAVVGLAVLAFVIFGGAKSVVNKVTGGLELEKYTSETFSFSIDAPKGWTPEEENEEFTKEVNFDEPVGDLKDTSEANKHSAYVRVDYEFADEDYLETTEQEYFDGLKRSIQRAIDDQDSDSSSEDEEDEIATVESEEMTTVDGLKAYKVKLKITNYGYDEGEIGYEYALFVYVDDKTQYEITIGGHESEEVHAKADSILMSFAKE